MCIRDRACVYAATVFDNVSARPCFPLLLLCRIEAASPTRPRRLHVILSLPRREAFVNPCLRSIIRPSASQKRQRQAAERQQQRILSRMRRISRLRQIDGRNFLFFVKAAYAASARSQAAFRPRRFSGLNPLSKAMRLNILFSAADAALPVLQFVMFFGVLMCLSLRIHDLSLIHI